MSDNLNEAITKLRLTNYIKANHAFDDYVADINKYATSNEQKAYFLGHLFKNKNISHLLPKDSEHSILHAIKSENLQGYFNHNTKPEFDNFKFLAICFLILGIASILIGTVQILNGHFSVGLSDRYLAIKVQEGGTVIIFGIMAFIGGLMRFSFEQKKQKFMAALISNDK